MDRGLEDSFLKRSSLRVGDDPPDRAKCNTPPEAMGSGKTALAAGGQDPGFHSGLMVLRLKDV